MPKAEHMSGSLGAKELLTCLQYSTWLKQSADSDLSPPPLSPKPHLSYMEQLQTKGRG